ncbi:hypothetical protein WJX84_003188 [Apatococcus fuscideae]|uniref:Uncharacterized protein n=1 Tax=Apatococcus fuscideae TaxID=2026836 RepID=A0AAW1T0Y4_9CHLO
MGHQPRTIAVKKLLEVALWEPLNQRFVTLSEASIPLYPPEVVYRQLLSETFSRINACDSKCSDDGELISDIEFKGRTCRHEAAGWHLLFR